jgi:hypothetical protein
MLLTFAVDPRGGAPASMLPASILAVTAIKYAIAPQLLKTQLVSSDPSEWFDSLKTTIGRFFWGFLIIVLIVNTFRFSIVLSFRSLGTEELNSAKWIESHTTPSARFLVFDWQNNWAQSSLLEWFPTLTGRRSITTVQGTEWFSGETSYSQQVDRFNQSRLCLYDDVSCLINLLKDPLLQFDYIVVSLKDPGGPDRQSSLLVSLENSTEFQTIYSSPAVMIFRFEK